MKTNKTINKIIATVAIIAAASAIATAASLKERHFNDVVSAQPMSQVIVVGKKMTDDEKAAYDSEQGN